MQGKPDAAHYSLYAFFGPLLPTGLEYNHAR